LAQDDYYHRVQRDRQSSRNNKRSLPRKQGVLLTPLIDGRSRHLLHHTAAVNQGKRKPRAPLLDTALPKHLSPKRANKIRRFFK
jgi:hypothetical protein